MLPQRARIDTTETCVSSSTKLLQSVLSEEVFLAVFLARKKGGNGLNQGIEVRTTLSLVPRTAKAHTRYHVQNTGSVNLNST
jgi:hypothetical protein